MGPGIMSPQHEALRHPGLDPLQRRWPSSPGRPSPELLAFLPGVTRGSPWAFGWPRSFKRTNFGTRHWPGRPSSSCAPPVRRLRNGRSGERPEQRLDLLRETETGDRPLKAIRPSRAGLGEWRPCSRAGGASPTRVAGRLNCAKPLEKPLRFSRMLATTYSAECRRLPLPP